MTLRSIPNELGHLADVDLVTSAPGEGDVLLFDGTEWVPGAGVGAGVHSDMLTADAAPYTVYVNGPHGVYDEATDRTYIAYLGLDRDLYVTFYDHQAGEVATPVEVGAYPIADSDNHGAPALTIDQAGIIHVTWGSHNTAHRHSKTTAAHDISAWSTQALSGTGTYTHLLVEPATGDLWLLDRSGDVHSSTFPSHEYASIRSSTDGSTWSSPAQLIDTSGSPETHSDAYLMGAGFGDDGRIHFTWLVARGIAHDGTRTNVYHAAYDTTTGDVFDAGGTNLGTVVDWTDHTACLAATASPVDWVSQRLDGDNIYLTFGVQNGSTDSTAHVAIWDGSIWTDVNTGITQPPDFSIGTVWPVGDSLRGIFTVLNGTLGDVGLYGSTGGSAWFEIATLLTGTTGDGYKRIAPVVGGGPSVALTMQEPDGTPSGAAAGDLLPLSLVIDPAAGSTTQGDHTHDYAAADHTHPGIGETVFAPDFTVTDGTTLDVELTVVWGIDGSGDPYYNAAGVTAGDEAVLVLDNATGDFSLRPIEVP